MIRKATNKDASRLAEILIFAKRTSYRKIFNDDKVSFNEMQVLDLALNYRDNIHSLDNIYVYDDGIVKGMIKYTDCPQYKDTIEIIELYIDTFFQGEGIGHALINSCIEYCKTHNFKTIVLDVLEENKNARRFYEKHGFIYTGIHAFEPGTTTVVLKYELKI